MKQISSFYLFYLCWIACNATDLFIDNSGRPKSECFLLSGRLRWMVLPKERYDDSFSGRESYTQPSNWEADTLPLSYRRSFHYAIIIKVMIFIHVKTLIMFGGHILGGSDFCFHYMFKTNFSGHNKSWGGRKNWGYTAPECPPRLRPAQLQKRNMHWPRAGYCFPVPNKIHICLPSLSLYYLGRRARIVHRVGRHQVPAVGRPAQAEYVRGGGALQQTG